MFYKKRGRDILRYLQVITFECFVTNALSERYMSRSILFGVKREMECMISRVTIRIE